MPKGGTVDISAIIQAVLCAAVVAGSAVLFELLPGRAGEPAGEPALAPVREPVPRAVPEL